MVLRDPRVELRTTDEDLAANAIAGKGLVRWEIEILPERADAERSIGGERAEG
jgi:hypothetical protein